MIPAHVSTRLEGRPLFLASRCDICGKPRNKGKHDKCSRQRQKELLASSHL